MGNRKGRIGSMRNGGGGRGYGIDRRKAASDGVVKEVGVGVDLRVGVGSRLSQRDGQG